MINLIIDILKKYSLYSISAVRLLAGTMATESDFGQLRRQLYNGPARGIFQMEEDTFNWLHDKYKLRYPNMEDCKFKDIENNDEMAILFARLRYYVVKEPIPYEIEKLALYWKKYYNTIKGKGNPLDFIKKYKEYVGDKI